MKILNSVSALSIVWLCGCGARTPEEAGSGGGAEVWTCAVDADCPAGAVCSDGLCLVDPANAEATPATSDPGPDTQAPESTSDTRGFVGTWQGYIENYDQGDSDHLQVMITHGDNGLQGVVTLFDGPALPPVTDPDVGYPPAEFSAHGASSGFAFDVGNKWFGGFPYTAQEVTASELRLQLHIDSAEVWGQWCTLQTPYDAGDEFYTCLPNWGGSFNSAEGCFQESPDGQQVERDCGQLALCFFSSPCSCTASGCAQGQGNRASLDVALDDNNLEGSLSDFGNVRLTRIDTP